MAIRIGIAPDSSFGGDGFFIDNLTVSTSAGPLPTPALLLLDGLAVFGMIARKRRPNHSRPGPVPNTKQDRLPDGAADLISK